MTDIEPEENLPPVAHVTIVYNGPVAPHWEMKVRYGDQKMLDDFWTRVNARLLLLPKHDPQFRRNRERVNRDAERELIVCDWDLGEDDAETTSTVVAQPVVEEAPAADEPVAEEPAVVAVDGDTEEPVAEGEETAADEADADDSAPDDAAADDTAADDAGADDVAADDDAADDEEEAPADESAEMAAGQA